MEIQHIKVKKTVDLYPNLGKGVFIDIDKVRIPGAMDITLPQKREMVKGMRGHI